MAIPTPSEAYNPQRLEMELEVWEKRLCTFLEHEFATGYDGERLWAPVVQITPVVARALMDRVRIAGWTVRWDGSQNNPYFYLTPIPPAKAEPAPKEPWYVFWR